MVAIACVQRLHDRGERLPFSVEVAAFADEEGLRFGTTYLGSSVYAGAFEEERLNLQDRDGVTLREAVRGFGGDPDVLKLGGLRPGDLLSYCEVHIEQGPVLEEHDLPVGIVTAINGQSRVGLVFGGEAGHAGTVPMEGRQDALCAAAEFVLEQEQGGAACRQPLPDRDRGEGVSSATRRDDPLGRSPRRRLRPRLSLRSERWGPEVRSEARTGKARVATVWPAG
jgi:acetylornithine deacetylase/succinyl-diaminopimelate desuccinylase-like protein